MYIKKSNYKFHPKYTNEEKEKIALLYLNHEMGINQIVREFNLADHKVLLRWAKMYKEYGCIFETRGKTTKHDNPNKGRPRKYLEKPLEELSKEELIEREKINRIDRCLLVQDRYRIVLDNFKMKYHK